MDPRLINQIAEWEWKTQMENEKKDIHHLDTNSYLPIALEYCRNMVKSTLQQIKKLGRDRIHSIHSSAPA